MTDVLDQRIERALDQIVAATPELGPAPDGMLTAGEGVRSRTLPLVAAAVLALVGVGAAVAVVHHRGRFVTPAATVLQPAETLPDSGDLDDAPVTISPDSPRSWYRLQPDLDIAWQETETGSTEFCWRTPVQERCQPDGASAPIAIPTSGGQTLLVLIGADAALDEIGVRLSDGTLVEVPVTLSSGPAAIGVARLSLPPGTSVASTGTVSKGTPEQDDVTGQTLGPDVVLSDVPITVPARAELSYWRFLPDLDIAERETATGTELCWRTPAGTGCTDDEFRSPDVAIIPTDRAAIFLVRPAVVAIDPPPTDPLAPKLEAGPSPTAVMVTFSDGTSTSVAVRYGAQYGVGYARVDLPDGITVATAESQ